MLVCPGCNEENPPKFRLCGYCGTPLAGALAPPPREVRKTVTVVFCDLKDSTALGERLDAEALHELKEQYFAAMAAEIARHGGRIEKYIGDAIMAVFGLPRAHEDDALRAVRAALGMREALERLNGERLRGRRLALAIRTGINTGEVVASDDARAEQKLASGDAVNVAARLEQAASANEIYLGDVTWRLVRDAFEVEPVAPLELKGKQQPVQAYRLVAAGPDAGRRRDDGVLVGRDGELAALHAAFDEARSARSVRLVTVVGDAGVGKSRLVRELMRDAAGDAVLLRGRCLPYGDGVTFWPLRDIMTDAAGIRRDDSTEAARGKLHAHIGDAEVADRIAAAVGISDSPFPLPELYWAARKALLQLSAGRPVVALIDDLHWAETAFLGLLEYLLEPRPDAADGAAILLLATARPELLDARPDWSERPGARRLVLKPLDDDAAARVAGNRLGSGLPADVARRIVAAAEGNPLYVEQMLSMLIESGALVQRDGAWIGTAGAAAIAVPPTIQALLEARLDRLGRDERAVVEPASVAGLEFPQPAVEALVPDALRAATGAHLQALAGRQFIRRVAAAEAAAVYRFQHQLVRDAVYHGLLKRVRAQLHAEFVRWADRVNADRDRALEFQEILGWHLEQAHRYLAELGPLDERGLAIGRDGAARLGQAARRARARGDMHAAASLYRRAVALLPDADAGRAELLPELGETLIDLGEFDDARAALDAAASAATRLGDVRLGASATMISMLLRMYSGEPGDWADATLAAATDAIAVFERAGAARELATAWRLVGFVHGVAGRYGQERPAVAQAMAHARSAGDARLVARCGMSVATSALLGPTPVPDAIAQCEAIVADGLADRQAEAIVLCTLGQLRAMAGEFDAARAVCRRGRALLRELGQGVNAASTGLDLAGIELLAGDLVSAEPEVRADFEFLRARGETYLLATMAALLSKMVREQGRDAEALELSRVAEQAASADDIDAQALWRSIRAPILARSGDIEAAEALARAAVAFAQRTEVPALQADTLAELAQVCALAGRRDEARRLLDEALALYTRKGDVVSAARAAARSEALRQ